jgi:hypothetical protein
MAETTEIIRLQLQADQFAVQIQRQKDHIKDLNNQLKQTDITLKQKKQLIIDKAGAEKALKELQSQAKSTTKAIQNAGAGAEISGKSFLKMGLMMTGAIGAGRGLVELLKNLFKNSEVFQKINNAISDFGKTVSSMVDDVLGKFVSGLKSAKDLEFEKSLEKIREKSIENIASFEVLARQVEKLGSKLEPTATEQLRYSKAVEELKKQYPEYLSLMSTEIENHKENISLLEIKRRMLFDEIERKVITEEMEAAIRNQIIAERELQKQRETGLKTGNQYLKAIENKRVADEKVIEVESRYQEVIRKTSLAESQLANAKATAALKAGDEKRAKEAATRALEEEAKATDNLTKKVEAYDKARAKANEPKLETRELTVDESINKEIAAIKEVQVAYSDLEQIVIDTSLTEAEMWDLKLSKVQEFLNKYSEAISGSLNLGTTYNQIETAEIENKYAKEKELLDTARAEGRITEEKYKQDLLALELKAENDKKKINQRQQKIDIAMATMNMGVAITNALRTQPFFPLGLIMSGIATTQGLLNIALIKKQKFARGVENYIVPPGYPNDSYPIFVQSGERVNVETKEQQKENDNKRVFVSPYISKAAVLSNYTNNNISFMGSSTARIERLLEALNRNVAGLELSVAVNNTMNGSGIDKLATEITRNQEGYKRAGGNLADR